jgi:RHH-type rel operon transcriptional repressor/antitoxin RelB
MSVTSEAAVHMTARVPRRVKSDLDALAKSTGRNRNELVNEALDRFIDQQRWQIARIEEGIRQADAGDFVPDEEMDALWAEFGLEPEPHPGHAS